MVSLNTLQEILGVSLNNLALLEQAVMHSSYVNEHPELTASSNERLEYLGDAVLGLIIADKLYRDFPELSEGQLTKLRSTLVRQDTLVRVAKAVGLGGYLYLGKGEEASGGRNKPANLARAVEAVIAAVFLDGGLASTGDMILKLFKDELLMVSRRGMETDYKSRLQELMQFKQQLIPAYQTIAATGPDHERWFTVEVMAGNTVLGRGSGKSKKIAETEAARSGLEFLADDFTR